MATANLTVPIILNWKDVEGYLAQHDIVEVVRCKDCKWNLWMRCTRFENAPVTDEDFCSKGERRTDA